MKKSILVMAVLFVSQITSAGVTLADGHKKRVKANCSEIVNSNVHGRAQKTIADVKNIQFVIYDDWGFKTAAVESEDDKAEFNINIKCGRSPEGKNSTTDCYWATEERDNNYEGDPEGGDGILMVKQTQVSDKFEIATQAHYDNNTDQLRIAKIVDNFSKYIVVEFDVILQCKPVN